MISKAQLQRVMDSTKRGENGIRLCESAGKGEKTAEEGGTQRGRIQLEPSGTNGLCLGTTRHPCDKTHAYLCNNQALLKAVKRWVGEGGKATLVGVPDANILREAIEEL